MKTIDIEQEMIDNHSDEEVIAYLDKVATGLVQNYNTASKTNNPAFLWGSYGDVMMIFNIIRRMKVRNDTIEAQKQSMV